MEDPQKLIRLNENVIIYILILIIFARVAPLKIRKILKNYLINKSSQVSQKKQLSKIR